MTTVQDLKYKFNNLDVFGKIIAINVVVFLVGLIFSSLFRIDLFNYFELPSDIVDFLLQPWSIISYAFLHNGIWHLAFNMLFLYYLSRVTTNLFRSKMILNVYFLGIISGGIAYLSFTNLVPTTLFSGRGVLVGASAGVSALLLFVAAYMPNSEIRLFNVFNVKWKHIAMVLVGLDLVRMLSGQNQGGFVAHFGGYILGYVYATKLLKGTDIGTGFERSMDSFTNLFKPKSKLKTVHKNKTQTKAKRKTKTDSDALSKQKKIDNILDKISKSGYESLTADEKAFLFKVGKD
ncbi:rhomboid family protein [Winogradskyella bathintestinalis]|uniref:Rhomboid family intramembrane serine protease n=1 Tax=Winogradskyella bathintestinalis TaxID=3035208 RepID=A0ABT7ZTP7_9FLAO|nr:rhomboid family intramembrane serine protease [Winogradskyella bathintestinalis]MDN3492377.1 rhomboid family intramembrane serine protease [Winogradskyella bathintestinalis]